MLDTHEPGLDFIEVIERSVALCDVPITLIGRQWLVLTDADGQRRLDNPEDFVRREIATALKRNIRVIPALIEDTPMPRTTQLPEDPQPLTRRNSLELSDAHFHYDADDLIVALDRVLGVTPPPSSQAGTSGAATPPSASTRTAPPESSPAKPPVRSSFLQRLKVVGIACLIIAILFFLWHMEGGFVFEGRLVLFLIFLGLGIIWMVLSAITGRRGKA